MSGSNWRERLKAITKKVVALDIGTTWPTVLAGFLVISFVAWIIPFSKGYQAANEDYHSNEKSYQITEKHEQECLKLSTKKEALDCYEKHEKAYYDHYRANEDLNAQREMADWAEGILWATIIIGGTSLAVTSVGVYFVRQTLITTHHTLIEARGATKAAADTANAAVESNNISRLAIRESSRPFIIIQDDAANLADFHSGQTNRMQWDFTICNHGQSPAFIDAVEKHGFFACGVDLLPFSSDLSWIHAQPVIKDESTIANLRYRPINVPFEPNEREAHPIDGNEAKVLYGNGAEISQSEIITNFIVDEIQNTPADNNVIDAVRLGLSGGANGKFVYAYLYVAVSYRDFYGQRHVTSRLMRHTVWSFAFREFGGREINYRT